MCERLTASATTAVWVLVALCVAACTLCAGRVVVPPSPPRRRWEVPGPVVPFVATDKPVYHSGDAVRVRVTLVDALTRRPVRAPTVPPSVDVTVESALGRVVLRATAAAAPEGVATLQWNTTAALRGGRYTVRAAVAGVENRRGVEVRVYRTPRLLVALAPRVEGATAAVAVGTVRRVDGTDVTATAAVDRVVAHFTVPRDAGAVETVAVPMVPNSSSSSSNSTEARTYTAAVPAGAVGGWVTVRVRDGGTVESSSARLQIVARGGTGSDLHIEVHAESTHTLEAVCGAATTVYFCARDGARAPVADVQLALVDTAHSDAVVLPAVHAVHDGCGALTFVPERGAAYALRVVHPAGVAPPVALALAETPDTVALHVAQPVVAAHAGLAATVSVPASAPAPRHFTLRVHAKGREVAAVPVTVAPGQSVPVALDSALLDARAPALAAHGVLRLTLLENSTTRGRPARTPVAERLVFRRPPRLAVTVSSSPSLLLPGATVDVTVRVRDREDGSPVAGAVVGAVAVDRAALAVVERRLQPPSLRAMTDFEADVSELADSDRLYGDGGDGGGDEASAEADARIDVLLGVQEWRRFMAYNHTQFRAAGYRAPLALAGLHGGIALFADDLGVDGLMEAAVLRAFGGAAAVPGADDGVMMMAMADRAGVRYKGGGVRTRAAATSNSNEENEDESEEEEEQVFLRVRSNFSECVCWRQGLVTDETGTVRFSFAVSDAVTQFRLAVDALDTAGRVGVATHVLTTRLPVHAALKAPAHVVPGDTLELPVVVANDGATALEHVELRATTSEHLAAASVPLLRLAAPVAPGTSARVLLRLQVREHAHPGVAHVAVAVHTRHGVVDRARAEMRVEPRGIAGAATHGGVAHSRGTETVALALPRGAEDVRVRLRVCATPVARIEQAIARLVREPCGCFEQASATVYPMVLALQLLRQQGRAHTPLAARLREKLARGAALLRRYEVRESGGFEWFGRAPAHEALTAYGVLEFADMARVNLENSEGNSEGDSLKEMLERAQRWLLARADAEGRTFRRSDAALDTFGRAPEDVTNAYILWALSEAGLLANRTVAAALAHQVAAVTERAEAEGADPYLLALVACLHQNLGDTARAATLAARLVHFQQGTATSSDEDDNTSEDSNNEGAVLGAHTSITASRHRALAVETTALAVLAWLPHAEHAAAAERAVAWLARVCEDGRFGGTQGTVLALKALVAHAAAHPAPRAPVNITLALAGTVCAHVHNYDPDSETEGSEGDSAVLTLGGPECDALVPPPPGAQEPRTLAVTVTTQSAQMWRVPYTLTATYTLTTPPATAERVPSLQLNYTLDARDVREGAGVAARVAVANGAAAAAHGMVVAVLGVPGGLQLRTAALDELVARGTVAAYETAGARLVLYWRGVARGGVLGPAVFALDARVPGSYTAPPARAYVYYDDRDCVWAHAPLRVDVVAAAGA